MTNTEPAPFGKNDRGSGKLRDYQGSLLPKNARVTIQLAGSDPHAEVIREAKSRGASTIEAFIAPRTVEEERTDAPMPVRLFIQSRMTDVVGWIPRGLEAPVIDTLRRLEEPGRSPRVPTAIVSTRHGLRVNLLIGQTR
ncbi:hypothetical protein [Subtercola endophyticus]|uniref:hypothetical protein n=1 Tax=Subtercola endophyticus TaxID=2895559 RepID=UPI001E374B64|nr:hypothetical protein [Subtercola endophyticus]UFS58212.1 hypothetical protein LQ955_14490 [Subtercola endophyticus]